MSKIEKFIFAWLLKRAIERKQIIKCGYAKFWARQNYAGYGEVDYNEGLEFCKEGEIGDDDIVAQPIYLLSDLPDRYQSPNNNT